MMQQIVQLLKLILLLLVLSETQFFGLFIYRLQQILKKRMLRQPKQFIQIKMKYFYQIAGNMLKHTSYYLVCI